MKYCSGCEEKKSLDCYSKKGKGKLQSRCKECNKKYLKNHYRENLTYYKDKARKYDKKYKKEIFIYLRELAKDGCKTCGETDFRCLQFHHINSDNKTTGISRLVHESRSIKLIKEEVTKCEVLCANCHFKHTAEQFDWYKNY